MSVLAQTVSSATFTPVYGSCLAQCVARLHSRNTQSIFPSHFRTTTTVGPGSASPLKTRGRRRLRVKLGEEVWVDERAIPFGVNRAYDQALLVIKEDAQKLRKQLKNLVAPLREAREAGDRKLVEQLRGKMHILNVQSKINLPQIRWRFLRGMGDMSRAVYRHLAEQQWRNEGALDLCMERVYQMHVVPDALPAIHPTLDLRVMFDEAPPNSLYLRTRVKRLKRGVEPGSFLLPEQTRNPPNIFVTAFHPDPRFYTLVMVDLDVPDPNRESFKTFLHWLIPNIEISSTSTLLPVLRENYVPPHPQRGTPYHRYTMFLFQHPDGKSLKIDTSAPLQSRDTFDVRQFCAKYGFNLDVQGGGGGVFMWREVWNETVSDIYKNTLRIEEPVYGKMPPFDLYGEVKEMRKYR